MKNNPKRENWTSKIGVILAVAGTAVGIGNFLRFPGQIAEFGGGAFMLAYLIAFLIIGLPVCWSEWILGRYGGQHGYHSCPSIFHFIWPHCISKYLGIVGLIIPLVIYMFLAYIASWCLGYAVNYLLGNMDFKTTQEATQFWCDFVGMDENGSAFPLEWNRSGGYLLFTLFFSFWIIYRGVSRGIEVFCKFAVPTLIIIAIIILGRILLLTPSPNSDPDWTISNGLGFMWNPTQVFLQKEIELGKWVTTKRLLGEHTLKKANDSVENNRRERNLLERRLQAIESGSIDGPFSNLLEELNAIPALRIYEKTVWDQLKSPRVWLAATSQLFFSLAAGLGVILTYASYMKKDDDVVLGALCAASANEFCEVGLGGMITLPASFVFLGAAGVANQGTFGLGFNALPMVFVGMPGGSLFGFLFFFLLYLSGMSGLLASMQPTIAFLEEFLHWDRKKSVALVAVTAILGAGLVTWFSRDIKMLDTYNFWIATFLIYISACIQIILFGWALGIDRGFEESKHGAAVKIPVIFKYIIRYICPIFLLSILTLWIILDVFGIGGSGELDYHVVELFGYGSVPANRVVWIGLGYVAFIILLFSLVLKKSHLCRNNLNKKGNL